LLTINKSNLNMTNIQFEITANAKQTANRLLTQSPVLLMQGLDRAQRGKEGRP
jgi:hypothetical protein